VPIDLKQFTDDLHGALNGRPSRSPKVALAFPLRLGPWPEIVRGVYRYAAKQSPPWILCLHTQEDIAIALAGGPDGVIAMLRTTDAAVKLAAWGGPVVDTAATLEARVRLDGIRLGQVAAEHLMLAKGRRFAYVGSQSTLAGQEALQGFAERLHEAGLSCVVAPAGLFDDPYTERPMGRAAAAIWLKSLTPPVAIFASHDALAHRMVEVCMSSGLRVPEEVAVLGLLNDEFLCLTSNPPISSIAVPLGGVGFEAARVLAALMSGKTAPDFPVSLPPGEVVVRQSTDARVATDTELATALRFISDHAVESIGVGDIAESIGVSRSTLERRFRSTLGRGPLAELIRIRVERAKRMLAETSLSVKEIARTTGFHDTRHLSVTFRSKTGMSPLEYRAAFHPL